MNYDVVFHFDHGDQAFDIAIANIKNYYAAFASGSPSVAFVVNGPGVTYLLKTGEHAGAIREIAKLGASIKACNNALKNLGISPESLCQECSVVPAGVVELVALQEKGYAYVKP